ncbi:MAG: leucyl aminopeptidase family protein [Candidatus Gracilibacteria bacterium]|jgi:leucyl aminopeptidase
MKLALAATPPAADLLVLILGKSESPSKAMKSILGPDMSKQVEARIKAKDFEGEEGQSLSLFWDEGKWKRVVLLGRGEQEKWVPQSMEFLGAKCMDLCKAAKAKTASIFVQEKDLQDFANGAALGVYEFKKYKTEDKKAVELKEVHLVSSVNANTKKIIKRAEIFMRVSEETRDLINTCAGNQNPQDIADEAVRVAKKYKMSVTVFDDKKLQKMGCGALYAVGQGAKVGSRLVILEHRYKSKAKQPNLALIGKGITFDTGGLNLKPSGHIEDMKLDMCGAVTVLGTLQAIADAQIPGYFVGVMACAENALSDRSVHPGDVVTAYNGKTIEINNTDAEGRMVLSDALSYTIKHFKPQCMVDLATLTGAVTVALGYHITGVMGNNQAFIDEYMDCSQKMGERSWPLPLDEDFVKACKGKFSDLINATDGVRAGSIMGGAFLKHFTDDKIPWIHLDIAGSGWVERPTPTSKYGATAVGIRTLVELAERHSG